MTKRFLIIGQGAIGLPVAVGLARLGFDVTGLARTPKNYPDMDNAPVFTQKNAKELTAQDLLGFSHVLIIITPSMTGDRVQAYGDSYLAVCEHIAKIYQDDPKLLNALKRLYFLSSTSVYGENDGQVVNEYTKANPSEETAKILLDAENALRAVFNDKATMIRASGIYGVARTRLIRLVQANDERLQKMLAQSHYSNRIMDSDLVNVVIYIMSDDKHDKPVYIVSDTKPALMSDVLGFVAKLLGVDIDNVKLQPKTSGKQVVANIDANWLIFKDYQQGYAHIINTLDKHKKIC